jgi:hypothetical protein
VVGEKCRKKKSYVVKSHGEYTCTFLNWAYEKEKGIKEMSLYSYFPSRKILNTLGLSSLVLEEGQQSTLTEMSLLVLVE